MAATVDDSFDGDDGLTRAFAEARVADAVAERRRRRDRDAAAAASTTGWEVIRTLAGRSARVAVVTSAGIEHVGTITAAGVDVVVVATAGGGVAVRIDALSAVRTPPDVGPVGGAETGSGADLPGAVAGADGVDGVDFRSILAELADAGADVTIAAAGARYAGSLESVGLDVVVVRTEGAWDRAYVWLCSVTEASSSSITSG